VTKVYCSKCDIVFESRESFEKHLQRHSSIYECEICPVDTVIGKFIDLFRRKSQNNLE
jgi:hypothetical protein